MTTRKTTLTLALMALQLSVACTPYMRMDQGAKLTPGECETRPIAMYWADGTTSTMQVRFCHGPQGPESEK